MINLVLYVGASDASLFHSNTENFITRDYAAEGLLWTKLNAVVWLALF